MQKLSAILATFMLATFAMPSYANTSYESETDETSKPGKTKKTRKTKVAKETREVREMREARRTNDTNDTVVGYAWIRTKVDDESTSNSSKIFLHHMFGDHFGINLSNVKSYGEYTDTYYLDLYPDEPVYTYSRELEANNIAAIVSTSADDMVSYFGKVGVSIWKSKISSYPIVEGPEKGNDLLLGAGVRINAGSRAVFTLEYEKIEMDDHDVAGFTASVGFRF